MGGGTYTGGREAAAILLRLRARTQQNATRPNINTPMMAAPAAMPSIAPLGSPLCEFESESELALVGETKPVAEADPVTLFVGLSVKESR